MAILTNLFGESPFGALEAHAEKVHECVQLLGPLFQQLAQGDTAGQKETTHRIFTLETEADAIRNRLHEMLTAKAIMALSKEELFNILEHQDSMADRAEDIAATLTYRDMSLPPVLLAAVRDFLNLVLARCELAAGVMSKLDLLVESSFAGRDAITVSRLITELSEREEEVKLEQIELTRNLLAESAALPPVEALLWLQILGHLADLSKCANRTGNGIRLTLKVKSSD